MIKAVWNGKIIAQSNNTVIVDRKHYFPKKDVNPDFLEDSDYHTVCSWKGEASYFNIKVADERIENAAWYYPNTSDKARHIENYIAFSYIHGVDVIED